MTSAASGPSLASTPQPPQGWPKTPILWGCSCLHLCIHFLWPAAPQSPAGAAPLPLSIPPAGRKTEAESTKLAVQATKSNFIKSCKILLFEARSHLHGSPQSVRGSANQPPGGALMVAPSPAGSELEGSGSQKTFTRKQIRTQLQIPAEHFPLREQCQDLGSPAWPIVQMPFSFAAGPSQGLLIHPPD